MVRGWRCGQGEVGRTGVSGAGGRGWFRFPPRKHEKETGGSIVERGVGVPWSGSVRVQGGKPKIQPHTHKKWPKKADVAKRSGKRRKTRRDINSIRRSEKECRSKRKGSLPRGYPRKTSVCTSATTTLLDHWEKRGGSRASDARKSPKPRP